MKSNYPVFSTLQLNTPLHKTTGNRKPSGNYKWFINVWIFAALLLMPFFSGATVVYVTPTGAGNHNGLSWANACTLNQAATDWFTCQLQGTQGCAQGIADCGDHDSIWMSKGTHTAIVGNFGVTFFFNVYGGFNGNETSFSQRNPALYVTKISGPGKFQGSVIPVLTGNPCSPAYMDGSATVDGIEFDSCLVSSFIQLNANNCTFAGCLLSLSNNISATHCNFQNGGTVEFLGDGYETSASFSNCNFSYLGGTSGEVNSAVSSGLLIPVNFSSCTFDHNVGTMGGAIDAGDIILTANHCTFTNNTCIGNPGGAIYAAQYLTVTNSTFSNNTATGSSGGGAIYNVQYSATISNCSFTSNSAPGGDAGAVYTGADDDALSQDTFSTNSAMDGGAVFLSGRTTVYYSVFESNTATATGGAIANGSANSYIESCLLVANSAQGQGGGGGIGGILSANAYTSIYNNTFVNNIGPGGSAMTDNGGSTRIENNILWATNTQLYPLFASPGNSSSYSNNMSIDGSLGTEANPLLDPNYTLAPCSPAINVGDNGIYEGQTVTDLAGNPRIYGGTVDLGCYEYQGKKTFDTAQVSITSNHGNSICAAYPVTFTATPVNGGTAPSYQWKKNGVNAGSNSATYNAGTLNANDSVECIMTSSDLCAIVPAVTSNTMKVLPALIPGLTVSANPTGAVCQGSAQTFTASPVNGGTSPSYQWLLNNVDVGNTSGTYTDNSMNPNDVIKCVMESDYFCLTTSQATNSISPQVNATVVPAVSISANPGSTICAGTSVTFTASPTNGGSTPAYQWKKNGNVVGSNSSQYTDNGLNNNDIITCVLTSNANCASPTTATSSKIMMTVNPLLTPSVGTATATGTTICQGADASFEAQPINGGAAPVYQWYLNGSPSGTNNAIYNSTSFNNGDMLYCAMTSNATCASPATANTDTITMTVNPLLTPSVSIGITGGSQTICSGAPVTFTATPVNAGTEIAYTFYVNGNFAQFGSSATYTSATLNNNDSVTCKLAIENNNLCVTTKTAISNSVTMTVNPWLTPSVGLSTITGNTICAGSYAGFTAQPVNGGTSPAYQWYLNGSPSGANSATYNINTFSNNDVLYCVMTSNVACPTVSTATSESETMTVNPLLTPSVNIGITDGSQTICNGTPVTFTATTVNAGNSILYTFKVNGNFAQFGSPLFTTSALNNNDSVTCAITIENNNLCVTTKTLTSNSITMTVNPVLTPSVSIAITNGEQNICAGSPVTFTATQVNGGTNPDYNFMVNGNSVQDGSADTFASASLNNGDVVSCVLTSNATCISTATATSDSITMTVNPLLAPSVGLATLTGNIICAGSAAGFTAEPINGGASPAYQWYLNGSPSGTNNATYNSNTFNNGDVLYCVMTSNATCVSPSTATSDSETITVNPLLAPSVGIAITGGSQTTCIGTPITFTATPVNAGTNLLYFFKVNGGFGQIGASPTFTTSTLNNNDSVSCVMTIENNHLCVTTQTATSNSLTMTVGIPPVLTCPGPITLNADSGLCSSSASIGIATSTNGCGTVSITASPVGPYPVGTTTVTWTVTDIHGNSATCNQTVTVTDNQLPTIICPATVNVNADAGLCSASNVSLGTPVTGDNCGVASVSNNAPSIYPVGNTTVTWTVTDIHGNSATCNQTVTVTDNQLPTIICPATVSVYADAGLCSASNVSLGTPVTGDNCGVASVINNAPSTYAVGNTTVTWTVTDIHGNSASCNQTVTVTDNQLPTIICPATVNVNADAGKCSASNVSLGTPVTGDNCGVASVSNNAPSIYPVGNTTVTWTVTDIHGNSASCNQTVTVTDNQLPTIICPATVSVYADAGKCSASNVSLGTPVTGDNCGVANVINNAPSTYAVGNTTVTWTVTDIHGNSASCNQTVTVTDNQLPTIICPATVNVNTDAGQCSASHVSLGTPVTGDNCGVASVSNNAPAIYPVGNTTVTWTVTDIHGNSATCNQTVTVTDNQVPVITCAAGIAITANQTSCNKPLTITAPVATDNCGVASVKNSVNGTANASGAYAIGTTDVLWTATDIHGLTATCTQVVTVYPCMAITSSVANTICLGTANGSIALTVTGGNGTYTYHWSNGQTTATAINLAANTYTVTVNDQAQGTATATFTVGTTVPAAKPATPGAISGLTAFCENTTNTYSIAAVPYTASYTWTVPNNATIQSGQGTTQITVKFASAFNNGTISVLATNCKGSSNKSNLSVSLFAIPARTSITGSATVCIGSTQSYTAATVTGASNYTWTVPAHTTITSGQGTATLTVQYQTGFTSGNIGVYASNCIGNGSTTNLYISPETAPAEPGSISGTTSICPNVTYEYLISSVTNAASYTWTVPANATILSGQGTTTINVQYTNSFTSGNISVYASDCAGNGTPRSLSISLEPVPAGPSSVTGTASICPNVSYQYGINSVTNATSYTWTVPANATIQSGQGTNSIKVEYTSSFTGGNISVYASDCAGNGAARNVAISPQPVPAEPSAIEGTASICVSESYQYVINSVANATSYTWTVPANGTIRSGQGTTSIKVEYASTFTGGNISVYASDCAGNGHAQTVAITKATKGCGTEKMDDDTSGVSGINEPSSSEFEVKLYPNPFTDQFYLSINSSSTGPVTLSIYTTTGQLVEERREEFTGTDIIMGSSLADGVYLIQIKQEDKTKVLRFIKSQ